MKSSYTSEGSEILGLCEAAKSNRNQKKYSAKQKTYARSSDLNKTLILTKPYFVFREPSCFDELKTLLHLRYAMFRNSKSQNIVNENENGIDLDCYDLYSHHLGWYEYNGSVNRPIGYVRLVTDKEGAYRDELLDLAMTTSLLDKNISHIPKDPFPLMEYCPNTESIQNYCNVFNDNKTLAEVSRLSLDRSYTHALGLKFVKRFIHTIAGACIARGIDEALLSCTSRHKTIYQAWCGAKLFYDIAFKSFGRDAYLLLLVLDKFPSLLKQKAYEMAKIYKRSGCICYYPDEPENYNLPSETS